MKKLFAPLVVVALFGLGSCLNLDSPCIKNVSQGLLDLVDTVRLNQDSKLIDAYLVKNGISAIKDPTGLRYRITQEGTGDTACLGSYITANYSGRFLANGATFDQSGASPRSFRVSDLILGWQIGFLKLKKGSKAVFYVPSGLAYGVNGKPPSIPGNSVLIFDLEVIDIQQ